MKPSQSKAASSGGVNSTLSKRYGTPKNLSNCSGGRTTKGDSRAKVNSSISGMKWGESPNDYGKGV
jgi:hypothetical protein